MSLFKKKDEDQKTIRPKLRPVGGDAKEKAGTSGKGGGQPAEPKYDVNAKGWNDQVAKFNKKGGKNNDGRFGYGYVDTETGIEVPWYIDMINGGGANAAGDTFVSPFEDAPMGGGLMGIGSQAISGGLNAMGVAPYGSNRPRYFMPMEAARVDAEGKPVQVDQGPASIGGGSPTVTPNKVPTSTIMPILNANQVSYEQEAFPRLTSSQAAASEDAYTDTSSVPTTRGKAGGPNVTGNVTEVNFKPSGQMTSLFDTRQQSPQPDEQRIMQKIADAGQMPYFMQQPPHIQRAQIAALRERGY